jgi:hypothetical protein
MSKEMSMFQQLIFSILMRHKEELYRNLDQMILEQINETKIENIIRKMFYEIKMPDMEQKMMAFINNEFLSVIGRYVDDYNVERKVQKHIDNIVDEKTVKVLKEKYIPKIPQEDILLSDFQIESENWSRDNWLSTRTVNCLKTEGVKTIGDLLCWCEHQLLKTPNLGKKSLVEIKTILGRANLSLGKNSNSKFKDYNSKCQSCLRKENA